MELVRVVQASDGETIITDIEQAQYLKDNNLLTIQDDSPQQLSQQDVFGDDYEASGTVTGI